MNNNLKADYIFDRTAHCWLRQGAGEFGYSDGDEVEQRLLNILEAAQDLSSASFELRSQITDWPTRYHLSPLRGNLLRPFQQVLKGSILEVGAGCGAITRFLGENGGDVLALEGSAFRAKITASRCRGLDNVTVVADAFHQFRAQSGFDVVTLIGVIEYARKYFVCDSADPVDAMLAHARRLLRPGGILIVAIENQLGLKYFAGFPEDHTGVPMHGIEDQYRRDSVVTFGQAELRRRLTSVGFHEQKWWFPFPDYKLPVSILSEDFVDGSVDVDLSPLLENSVSLDPQRPRTFLFSLEKAWQPVFRNQLAGKLANSFLVVASGHSVSEVPVGELGYHFAVERRRQFAKKTVFLRDADGKIGVRQKLLFPDGTPNESLPLTIRFEDEAFVRGVHWQQRLIEILNTPNWRVVDLEAWASTWLKALLEQAGVAHAEGSLPAFHTIPGDLLDALPRNMILREDDRPYFIDQEWRLKLPMELGFLVFRGVALTLLSVSSVAQPTRGTPTQVVELFARIAQSLGIWITQQDVLRYLSFENDVQRWAIGVDSLVTADQFMRLRLPVRSTVAERDDAMAQRDAAVAERDGQIGVLQQTVTERDGLLNQKDEQLTLLTMDRDRLARDVAQVVAERDGQIAILTSEIGILRSSTCWKITAPLRIVGDQVKRIKRLWQILPVVIQRGGGVKETAGKALAVFSHEGLPGIKQRLRTTSPGVQDAWNEYRQTFNQEVKPRIIRRIREIGSQPRISIIVATFNTPETMLREMIKSVNWQLYPNWELCIADDGSSQPHVKRILEESASKDRRIKVHFGVENRGVSHASNRALEMATGDFVVLLDHDDILEEQALFRFAESILEEKPDMVYSDEVLVTPDGATVKQYVYRPAFSPEFLRGHPYIVHLVGFRSQLLRDIGGFNENLFISQDYDLVLRVTEKARTIVHIPEILYRWRVHSNSAGHQRMQEVMETSQALLQRHLERCGEIGTVHGGVGFNLFDVRYPLGDDLNVAIIIPTKNHGDILRRCIESIQATVSEVRYEIVIIDHESEEPDTLTYLSSISPGVRVLRYQGVFNFSAINNFAVSQLGGEYSHYLFCNNDVEAIAPGWLERMLELGQHPSVGIVGAKLLYPDRKTIQHAGVCVGAFGRAEHYGKFLPLPEDRIEPGYFGGLVINHEVAAVTAACLLIRKETFEEISGFDESFAIGFGDVDLCLRAGARGNRVLFCPYAQLVHYESATRGTSSQDTHPEDTARYRSKWRHLLEAGDPYYNPGLSLESTTWQVKPQLNCNFLVRRRIVIRDKESGKDNVSILAAAISCFAKDACSNKQAISPAGY